MELLDINCNRKTANGKRETPNFGQTEKWHNG
jgi:hypothetical protein